MKLYKLHFVVHEPSYDTEDKFMAEILVLPGCRAWGDTYDDALENLQDVAAAMVESYREAGDELPAEVRSALGEDGATMAASPSMDSGECFGAVSPSS